MPTDKPAHTPGPWRLIKTFDGSDYQRVDLWMNVHASPRSMGIADAFRVVNAFRVSDKWFDANGELYAGYITHWMPIPEAPPPTAEEVAEAKAVIDRAEGKVDPPYRDLDRLDLERENGVEDEERERRRA